MVAFAWDKWILLEVFLLDFFFQNCLGSISLITHYRCISWSVPTVCDFLPWFSNSGDTQISVYIHVTSFSKSILGQSVLFLTRLQCTCAAWSVLSAVTTFLWNSYHLKFTSSCVNILSVFISGSKYKTKGEINILDCNFLSSSCGNVSHKRVGYGKYTTLNMVLFLQPIGWKQKEVGGSWA